VSNNAYAQAFPLYVPGEGVSCGLTKRELFAAMALQGCLASDDIYEQAVRRAISAADMLLAELEKGGKA